MSRKLVTLILMIAVVVTLIGANTVRAQEPVTITYWDSWVTQGAAVDEAIALFEKNHPNINVEKTTQGGGGYDQLLNAAFTAGPESTPDVFVLPGSGILMSQAVESNWLLALNTFEDWQTWRDSVPNADYVFLPGADNNVAGNYYSAKFWADQIVIKMFVNMNVYEAAGLTEADLPETLDDLIANSRAIVEKTDAYGLGFSGTQAWAAGWWMSACDFSTQLETYVPFGRGFNWVEGRYELASDPCANAALNGLVQMRDEGLIHPETTALTIDDEAARVLFASDQFAHLVGGNWVIGGWATTNPDFHNFRIIRMPLMGVDQPQGARQAGPGGRWFAISTDTEHPQESWEFFKFLNSPEFASIWIKTNDETLYRMDAEEYGSTQIRKDIIALDSQMVIGLPVLGLRNPDTNAVTFTLTGPSLDEVVMGVFSGAITDIPAALTDLDTRYQAAFEQGIADAQAAGLNVKVEDYIFPDWVPTEPYVQEVNAGE